MAAEMVPPTPSTPTTPPTYRYRFTFTTADGEVLKVEAETCDEEAGKLVLRAQGEVVREVDAATVTGFTSERIS